MDNGKKFNLYSQRGQRILTCDLKGASTLLEGFVDTAELDELDDGETCTYENTMGEVFLWERIA